MAKQTSKTYRNEVIYSVFVRNHSEEGTFDAVRHDLSRIKRLGVDIIWLLPVHPIGKAARKGTLGSPYAISDYRGINPEYGTLDDFVSLVDAIHAHGMKCIIDVVYNHTSPDSWLAQHRPGWLYHKEDGSFGNKVGEWPDVIDLDYGQAELWDYQIQTLKQWAQIVDGFRCDVAPLIPLDFWLRARQEVEAVRPGCFWLAESVEPVFTMENRARGFVSLSDSEVFQAFDACYEYDIFSYFKGYVNGQCSLAEYADSVNRQEAIYPDNYIKLRYLENHDNARAKSIIQDEKSLVNWTAFIYFQKGMTLLYAGQEAEDGHLPSLFEKDTVRWDTGADLSPLLSRLYEIKKHPLMTDSRYEVRALPGDILYATHCRGDRQLNGVFSVRGQSATLKIDTGPQKSREAFWGVNIADGVYKDMLCGGDVRVKDGEISCCGDPLIFESIGKASVDK